MACSIPSARQKAKARCKGRAQRVSSQEASIARCAQTNARAGRLRGREAVRCPQPRWQWRWQGSARSPSRLGALGFPRKEEGRWEGQRRPAERKQTRARISNPVSTDPCTPYILSLLGCHCVYFSIAEDLNLDLEMHDF
jgi:hypothetical protein